MEELLPALRTIPVFVKELLMVILIELFLIILNMMMVQKQEDLLKIVSLVDYLHKKYSFMLWVVVKV